MEWRRWVSFGPCISYIERSHAWAPLTPKYRAILDHLNDTFRGGRPELWTCMHQFICAHGQLSNSDHLALLTLVYEYNQRCVVGRRPPIQVKILGESLRQFEDSNSSEISHH